MAVGTSARDPARVLIQSWLSEGAAWHPVAWRPDVAATRILAWIVHFEELAGRDADRALRRAMLASIAAQVRHLARVAGWELTGAARLRALKGLIGGLGRARRAGTAHHCGRCAASNASCRRRSCPMAGT